MDYASDDMVRQEIKMRYGQDVMNILALMGNKATEKELIERFMSLSRHPDQPEEFIVPYLQEILYRGVTGGFLDKSEDYYSIPGYKCSSNNPVQSNGAVGTETINETVNLVRTPALKRKFEGDDDYRNTKNPRVNEM